MTVQCATEMINVKFSFDDRRLGREVWEGKEGEVMRERERGRERGRDEDREVGT